MSAQINTQIPQGFSVYQPMLGAPLQFFPALGTQELDDMLNAYIVGPASVKDKRANVSVDFLDYAQRTGQTFKFYAVPGMMAPVESPMASPFQASTSASSINASPVASSWDWTAVSAPTPSASARPAKAARTGSVASSRRSTTADFSHIPGMKILTKDGMDVTNSASRGSKTKEQRDHAHLMRIIKACDSCKKKKIRCDPSHKKRTAAPQPAKVTKTQSRAAAPSASVAAPQPDSFPQTPVLDFDSSLTPPEFENLDIDSLMKESWEDFIQYPAVEEDPNYDFFLDPQGFFSQTLDQQATSSSDNSPVSWSDEQFNAFVSSSADLTDYGLIQSTSTSTSPSTLDLDASSLPPDLPPPHVPLNPSDHNFAQTQPESVAMPDLYQPAGGFGPERYATSLSQFLADGAESRSSSSTESSRMLVSPLGSTTSTRSSPAAEDLHDLPLVNMAQSSFSPSASGGERMRTLRGIFANNAPVMGALHSISASPQENANAAQGQDSQSAASPMTEAVTHVLQPQTRSRSSDLDHTPGSDSSGALTSRGVAYGNESVFDRSSTAPISARLLSERENVRDEHVREEPITGTDCSRSTHVEIVAPRNEPATGTDCLARGGLQLPLQTNPSIAESSASATPLQLQTSTLPRLGSLSGQTSSSLVLASATLYSALEMLLAKQQRKSFTDKGRRRTHSSWLEAVGKLAIIPMATVLATGLLPGWSFMG